MSSKWVGILRRAGLVAMELTFEPFHVF